MKDEMKRGWGILQGEELKFFYCPTNMVNTAK
jgi:hypothetical protein